MAYGLSASGSDWEEWKVKDVVTGQDLVDHLKWVKFSGVSWTPDGKRLAFCSNRHNAKAGETNVFVADWVR